MNESELRERELEIEDRELDVEQSRINTQLIIALGGYIVVTIIALAAIDVLSTLAKIN